MTCICHIGGDSRAVLSFNVKQFQMYYDLNILEGRGIQFLKHEMLIQTC